MTTVEPAVIPLTEVGSLGRDRIIMGYNHEGHRAVLDRAWRHATLVSGEPGSGKGGTVRVLQHHDITVGNQVLLFEPKPGEYGWVNGAATRIQTPTGMTRALMWAVGEMHTRQRILADTVNPETGELGIDKFTDLPDPWHRIVLYLDELPAITGAEAFLDISKEEIADRQTALAALVKRGRSVGVNVVLISQRPTIADMFAGSEKGGGIYNSVPQRIHCDRDTESLKQVFKHCGEGSPAVLRAITDNRPGRVAYAYCDEADQGRVMAGQILWIEQGQARSAAETYEGPEPIGFD